MLSPLFPPYPLMLGPGTRTPGTPGGQRIYTFTRAVGPGPREVNKYTHSCGARGPYTRNPGRSENIRNYVEPVGPALQVPREVNEYTQLCEARGPRTTGTPGGQQIHAIMCGPGAPGTKDSVVPIIYTYPKYTKSKTKPPRKSDIPA